MSEQPAPADSAAPQPDAWSASGAHDMPDSASDPSAVATAAAPEQAVSDDAAAQDGPADAAALAASPDAAAADADHPNAFLHELVQAMRTTAAAEKVRIAADADRRREEHLASIQARRESEAQRIRELADDDLKAIDAWAEEERQRTDRERARRAEALATDLETSLAQHGARVDGEVERVEAAIATYRVEVDEFFTTLERETDPVAIAQHAGRRPTFPDLAAAAIATAGSSETEAGAETPEPIGVMESHPGANLAASVAAWNAGSSAARGAIAAHDVATQTESATQTDPEEPVVAPVAVVRGAHDNGPGTVLHAVPSGRPLSWLRRDRDNSDNTGDK
ncbi:MAG TPA: hypothetical protein VGJ71_07765 [Candidatus Limnocylindrales bacterium]